MPEQGCHTKGKQSQRPKSKKAFQLGELRRLHEGKLGDDDYWRQYTYHKGKYTLRPLHHPLAWLMSFIQSSVGSVSS